VRQVIRNLKAGAHLLVPSHSKKAGEYKYLQKTLVRYLVVLGNYLNLFMHKIVLNFTVCLSLVMFPVNNLLG
jgi:hypothetical protein